MCIATCYATGPLCGMGGTSLSWGNMQRTCPYSRTAPPATMPPRRKPSGAHRTNCTHAQRICTDFGSWPDGTRDPRRSMRRARVRRVPDLPAAAAAMVVSTARVHTSTCTAATCEAEGSLGCNLLGWRNLADYCVKEVDTMGITSILDAQNQKGTPDFAFHGCPSNDHLADNTVLRTRAGRPVDVDVGCTPLG